MPFQCDPSLAIPISVRAANKRRNTTLRHCIGSAQSPSDGFQIVGVRKYTGWLSDRFGGGFDDEDDGKVEELGQGGRWVVLCSMFPCISMH